MSPLFDVVEALQSSRLDTPHADAGPVEESVPRLENTESQSSIHHRSPQSRKISLFDSPALRTGPPRSISYSYSLSQSPLATRQTPQFEYGDILEAEPDTEDTEFPFHSQKEFRGALEFHSPEQREREKEVAEKKEKERESRQLDNSWNLIKWFHESPGGEKNRMDLGKGKDQDQTTRRGDIQTLAMDGRAPSVQATEMPSSRIQRSVSLPHNNPDKPSRGTVRWNRLRSLLPTIIGQGRSMPGGQAAITPQNVNITDELMVGGLSTLMLRLWFERDEKDHRRVPILFHRLRIRISDSLHPMHAHKSVFRIECEYGNGAARWVIYRQLRDFISLHTHYTFSNAYNRNIEVMPEFPRTSGFS
jgi:phospholipase D1/2